MSDSRKLVIVESPAKAKTIAQYLGEGYEVQASVGHIRDLIEPKNLPPELKKGSLGKFSIDVEGGFLPYYVVSDAKKRTVTDLKKALKEADELYLATDEDREGEAIAWHLLEVLKPKVPVKRMVFHEITKEAIEAARNNPRELDTALVDAQETRRILDRLFGFEISPVLWRKVGPGLSAGRVQSAATRLVVDRERERLAFISASYWDLTAGLAPGAEADLLRSLQLLPGIQSASDISSGLYVRGGGPDQTRILLDQIPLYNPSHAFGFFSTFNPDAVRDVQLYKGAYPASYGGSLGAVLTRDVRIVPQVPAEEAKELVKPVGVRAVAGAEAQMPACRQHGETSAENMSSSAEMRRPYHLPKSAV